MTDAGRLLSVLVITLVVVLGVHGVAISHDGHNAEWFKSLKQPGTGASCCDLSDCREVRSRVGAEGYEVFITSPTFPIMVDEWVKVPTERIIRGRENPTGSAVVCWTPHRGVICFVEGAGA